MTRQRLRLADGRQLGYLELGDRAGAPAIYLHGTPSSASEARWLHRPARARGVRLVSLDRPGYLRSDPRPEPSYLAVAEDALAVARALRLERFAVVGFSGGAGYALATAHVAPDEVTVVHLGGGMGSIADSARYRLAWWRRLVFGVAAHGGPLSALLLGLMLGRVGRVLERKLDAPDEAAFELFEGAARGAQVAAVAEYVRSSSPAELRREVVDYVAGTRATKAVLDDVRAVVQPWPFELRTISTQVELWHGTDDPAVPVAYAEGLAAGLWNAHARVFAGQGHVVFHTHGDAVVESIREHAGG